MSTTVAVDELTDYLTRRAGLSFSGSRGSWLLDAVHRVVGGVAARPAEAVRVLDGDEALFARLCDEVTVQESFFFREGRTQDQVRAALDRHDRRRPLKVWSAGCAAGEEAYTLAAVVSGAGLASSASILATDLSGAAVAAADRATYGRWSLRGVDEATIGRLFTRTRGGWQVREHLRSLVTVDRHNLLDDPPALPGGFDLVLCRNVLIYLAPDAVARVGQRLAAALAPGGWLLTSASDPMLDHVHELEAVDTGHGIAYRRRTTREGVPERAEVLPGRAAARHPVRRRAIVSVPRTVAAQDRTDRADELATARRALALGSPLEAERAARRAGADVAAHRLLVQALGEQGSLPEALSEAERAIAAFPLDAELRVLHALLLLETGDPQVAVGAARQAVYLEPQSAAGHLVLARCQEALGDHGAARRARRNARRLIDNGVES